MPVPPLQFFCTRRCASAVMALSEWISSSKRGFTMSNQDPKIEEGLTGVPASGEEFSLEEILAEYGGSLEQVLLRETEEATGEEAASREASALPTPTPLRQRNRRSLRQRPRLPLRPERTGPGGVCRRTGDSAASPSHYFGRCGGGYGRRRDGRGAPGALSFPTAEPCFPAVRWRRQRSFQALQS